MALDVRLWALYARRAVVSIKLITAWLIGAALVAWTVTSVWIIGAVSLLAL